MHLIDAPLCFPTNATYLIHGRGHVAETVRDLLTLMRPSATCAGLTDELRHTDACSHLLVEPDWPETLRSLRAQGVPENRLLVMPIPDGDMWNWWRFTASVQDDLSYNGKTVEVSASRFIQFLVELGRGRLEHGRLEIDPQLYGCTFADLWKANAAKIAMVMQRLADETSRENYARILWAPPEVLWQYYIETVFQRQQYAEHIRIAPGDVILNGGIATGTEIPFFLARLDGRGCLHNVDPLGQQFLTSAAATAVKYYEGLIRVHELALSDSTQPVDLPVGEANQAIGKHRGHDLEGFHTRTFAGCTVDELVDREHMARLDLVKLDLEGAEEYVLPGMLKTLKQFRPQIALSIYHRPQHLFELPCLLMQALENYAYYIESYSFERWEVVLYGVPCERNVPVVGKEALK